MQTRNYLSTAIQSLPQTGRDREYKEFERLKIVAGKIKSDCYAVNGGIFDLEIF